MRRHSVGAVMSAACTCGPGGTGDGRSEPDPARCETAAGTVVPCEAAREAIRLARVVAVRATPPLSILSSSRCVVPAACGATGREERVVPEAMRVLRDPKRCVAMETMSLLPVGGSS